MYDPWAEIMMVANGELKCPEARLCTNTFALTNMNKKFAPEDNIFFCIVHIQLA